MDCRKAEELLHLWIDDELDESERTALMAHLSECSDCARKLMEYRRLDAMLDQLGAQTVVPAGLFGRIMEAVNRESAPRKSGLTRWSRWAASAAAVLLLGVTVGVLWRAGVWPSPMGKTARYEIAQEEAAPMEAPAADMESGDGIMIAEATENDEAAGEPTEAPPGGEDYGLNGETVMEATWNVDRSGGDHRPRGAADAIEAFSAEHGLTVLETGDDWISIQWENDDGKQALLTFLEENGELTLQSGDQETAPRVLRIYIR